MKILKFTHYLYLVIALLFLIDAIDKLQNNENAIVSFLFVAVAVFMFFFRRSFLNRMNK
ncbi:hypothetical protein ABGT15_11295 [Flavobacterium enshiense]|uniref:hypothetical protein n=1 Tax=Flavobacterium enshiense TaxID=1341165 RepID=UPI00345D81FD